MIDWRILGSFVAYLALMLIKVVMKMVSFAWGGFGASFGPLILLSLFWKRINLAGAVSGMVTGSATCFVWKFVLAERFAEAYPIFGLYELAPGFALAFLVTMVVSLATKKPSDEIVAEFERVDCAFPPKVSSTGRSMA